VLSCSNEDEYLEVEFSSLQNGDTLYGNGLIIKFSEPLDLSQFNANHFLSTPFVPDSINEDELLSFDCGNMDSSFFYILSTDIINTNGNPAYLVYDSNNHTCAFFGVTNEFYPDGTGEGFVFQEQNNLLIKKNIRSEFGHNLKSDFSISFNKSELLDVQVVPNPYLSRSFFHENEYVRRIRFTKLPSSCTLTISTITGEMIATFIHQNEIDSNEWWDLTNGQNQYIDWGIYRYSLDINGTSYPNHGVFFVIQCNL